VDYILKSLDNFLFGAPNEIDNLSLKKEIREIHDNLKKIISLKEFQKEQKKGILENWGFKKEKKDFLSEIEGPSIGYYMHAMNLIFFILKFFRNFGNDENPKEIYRNIINFICNKGGDTDTNCCIVGGVVGAVLGYKNIESKYVEDHLNFNPCIMSNVFRPIIYSPIVLILYGLKLYPIINKISNDNQYSEAGNEYF